MLRTNFMKPSCAAIAFGSVAVATVLRALIDVLLNEQVPYFTWRTFERLCRGHIADSQRGKP